MWLRFDLPYLTFKSPENHNNIMYILLTHVSLDPIQVCSEEMNFRIFISHQNSGDTEVTTKLNHEVTRISLVYLSPLLGGTNV